VEAGCVRRDVNLVGGHIRRYGMDMKTDLPRRAVLAVVTLGMLVTTAIAGCAPGTPGAPAPSPSATGAADGSRPTPTSVATATASPESAEAGGPLATKVIIFSGLLGAYASDSLIGGGLDMFEPVASIDPVVDEISGYFGFEPIVEFRPADPSGDGSDYTSYVWDGFEILDFDYPASRVPARPEFSVYVTASDVRGVRVESIDGVSIGDSMAGLEAMFPADSRRQSGEFNEQIVVRLYPMDPVEGRYGPVSFAVGLAGPVGGDVEEIFSPYPDMQI